ncbi:glycine--tRNA ligase [Candidatus Marsarchaeota archaeon]|nr:glycine--tRNA ligase [Candidatus Marsarchaeota archaeon]
MEKASMNDLENLAARRGIIIPAFKLYGELAGFYDYGPIGTAIRNRLENHWRSTFIDKLGNLELSTTIVAPEKVFEASGHLANFTDPIVNCKKCHASYRADKLLEEFYEKKGDKKMAEASRHMHMNELDEEIKKNGIKCQKCGGELSDAEPFNLMLGTKIGPYGGVQGYLRPETAQGIFMDFKQVFRDGGYKLPLGMGQVGKAFRNEISPRRMLIRMREFSQMELEYFFDPESEELEINGATVKDSMFSEKINVLTAEMQENGSEQKYVEMSVAECMSKGYVPNKLFGFCLIVEKRFMEELGFSSANIRFRQVLKSELPHYSKGNFDMEVDFFGSFEEVSGTAYRTNFDLMNHQQKSNSDMSVINADKKLVPHVVEVSFGLDRLFWTMLGELLFKDGERGWNVLKLNAVTTPYDYALFPLQKDESLREKSLEIRDALVAKGMRVMFSYSGSIGKRYAKADETGIRLAITVDYQTLEDGTVTIRDSYDAQQKRVKIADI